MTSLTVRQLRVAYHDRVVIDGLDLEIPPGKITVIVGANACGKSTLLRTLARLLTPRSGVVYLDGRGRTPHQSWWRHWYTSDEGAVASALTATEMPSLADRPVGDLSGRQR